MLFSAAQISFEVLLLSKFVNLCVMNFSAILLLQVISAKVKWKRGLIIPNFTCNSHMEIKKKVLVNMDVLSYQLNIYYAYTSREGN